MIEKDPQKVKMDDNIIQYYLGGYECKGYGSLYGLSIYYNRKKRKWKIGENGEWLYGNQKSCLDAIAQSKPMAFPASLSDGTMVEIEAHESRPKFVSSRKFGHVVKCHYIGDDAPLDFPFGELIFKFNEDTGIYEEI